MKNRIAKTALIASLLTSVLWAQNPGKTLTSSQAVLELWNDIGRKLIAMAEDFPEDKYDFKPTPAQRSFRRATAARSRLKRSLHLRRQGREAGGR